VRLRDLDERKIVAEAFKLKASFSRELVAAGSALLDACNGKEDDKALDVKFERLRVAVEVAETILTKR
jgi:hypothetical protein